MPSLDVRARAVKCSKIFCQPLHPFSGKNYDANASILSAEEKALAALLIDAGQVRLQPMARATPLATRLADSAFDQVHLFAPWPAPGTRDADKRRLLAQVKVADQVYPGGLRVRAGLNTRPALPVFSGLRYV